MEGLIEVLTRGNVTEVKVVPASVALALAAYGVLAAAAASWTHRASGDAILVLTVVTGTATMCIGLYGFEEGGTHTVVALILLDVFATKFRSRGPHRGARSSRGAARARPLRGEFSPVPSGNGRHAPD